MSSNNLFAFIHSSYEQEMLQNAYDAITLSEKWEFMKQKQRSFQLCNAPEISEIQEKMIELGYDNHSGASFGYVMNIMHYIAVNGLEHYKIKCTLSRI